MDEPRQPPKKRALEDTFDTVVRQSGDEVVKDLLSPDAPQLPLNADYLLAGRTVVAELKCLQKDYSVDAKVGEKLQNLLDRWKMEGLIRAEHIVNGRCRSSVCPRNIDIS